MLSVTVLAKRVVQDTVQISCTCLGKVSNISTVYTCTKIMRVYASVMRHVGTFSVTVCLTKLVLFHV